MRNSMTQQDGFRRNLLRKKRSAWCKPAGRTQREIAGDLGLAYRRWSAGSGGARIGTLSTLAAESDVTAELKRLRRKNEILRQERDIPKKATAFFVREGSR